jgi:FkbM family methyltransferase
MSLRAAMLRTYCRLGLPGSRRLLWKALSASGWEGKKTVRLKPHGYRMVLDLAQVHDRWSFLVGQYYEDLTQRLLVDLLRPGESFVDVGANIGHLTLTAAHRLGATGRVLSFEPNPMVYARLSTNIDLNALGTIVRAHNVALGATVGTLRLSVPVEGTGGATLGRLGSEYSGALASQFDVAVDTGDSRCDEITGPLVIKIDVEGFETFVVQGLAATIARNRPALIVEAWPDHLRNSGSSIEALLALAHEMGYHVYALRAGRDPRSRRTPQPLLRRVTNAGSELSDDIVWLHPDGEHMPRVAHAIEG